jgi:CHAT domain-containing protein/tetratricopeptide (TPR) repeat protein
MKLCLSRLGLVLLAMLLWGVPVEALAEVLQPGVGESVELFGIEASSEKWVQKRELEPSVRFRKKQARETQIGGVKQADSDMLLSVEGSLEEGDSQLEDESLYDLHLFEGQASQIVRIRLTSNEFDTFLGLEDNSGKKLARNNDGDEGTNSEIVFQLPTTGQYRIIANAFHPSGRGIYKLEVTLGDEQARRQVALRSEANDLYTRGNDAFRRGQYQAAIEDWQTVLSIYRQLNDRRGEAISIRNLGLIQKSLEEYEQAISLYKQSLEIFGEIGDRQNEAKSLNTLGNLYREQGEYHQAIELHEQSLAISQEIGDRQGEVDSLGNLGSAYFRLGDYPKAIDLQQQSLAVSQEIGDRQGEADSLINLGLAFDSTGEYQQAINFYQRSLEIAREIRDQLGEAYSLANLGLTYFRIGEYQQAIELNQQSLAIKQEVGDRRGQATSMLNIGISYLGLEEPRRAIDFLQQSLEIVQEINDQQGEADSLGNLGTAHVKLGEHQQAIGFYQEQLAVAQEIGYQVAEADALGNLGIAFDSIGEYQQAIDYQQQSLLVAQEIGNPLSEAISLQNLGSLYLDRGEVKKAQENLYSSISLYETLRAAELPDQNQVSLFETQASAYKDLERVLILQNLLETALEISERGRTRAFVRLLSARSSIEPNYLENSQFPSFSEMQKIAREQQSTLIEYSISESTSGDGLSLYIWLIQPNGELHFKEVVIGESLVAVSELVEQSRVAMDVRGRGGFVPSAPIPEERDATVQLKQLHQLLIEPIADWLPDDPTQRVVFIPQGDLFLVPFPALIDESGTYLIEHHTVLTAPSIQTLDLTRRRSTTTASRPDGTVNILTVGNPVMPEVWNPESDTFTQLLTLIGAEQEAKAIASFFGTEALIGAQATEQAVKQQIENAHIVHLATHGLLEYGIPEESGVRDVPGAIALSPSQSEDGLLTATEIIEELNLQADLVVLSACDTGLGRVTGDGVIGLSRSLIAAGTPSVIVSLWSIPDAPTAELMVEFYRQRQQGQDKAQALRQAMLVTMKTHPNPRDWAAFTLIGEAN